MKKETPSSSKSKKSSKSNKKNFKEISIENDNDNYNEEDINNLFEKINQLKEEKQFEECIELIENSISDIAEKYSKESPEYYYLSEEVCDVCNMMANDYYSEGKIDKGVECLERCCMLFTNYKPVLHICYNNLGNYFRKANCLDKALECFNITIKVSTELGNKKNVAEGHINYSIILLSMNKVQAALEQALAGIILLQECLISKNVKSEEEKTDLLSILENSYILVGISKFKSGLMLESLLYYDLADKIRSKVIGENKKIKGVLNNDAKTKMLKEAFDMISWNEKGITDKNEKMASNYIKGKIKKMINELEQTQEVVDDKVSDDKDYNDLEQVERFQLMCKQINNI